MDLWDLLFYYSNVKKWVCVCVPSFPLSGFCFFFRIHSAFRYERLLDSGDYFQIYSLFSIPIFVLCSFLTRRCFFNTVGFGAWLLAVSMSALLLSISSAHYIGTNEKNSVVPTSHTSSTTKISVSNSLSHSIATANKTISSSHLGTTGTEKSATPTKPTKTLISIITVHPNPLNLLPRRRRHLPASSPRTASYLPPRRPPTPSSRATLALHVPQSGPTSTTSAPRLFNLLANNTLRDNGAARPPAVRVPCRTVTHWSKPVTFWL